MPESVQSCFELSIHLSVSEPAVNCSKNSSREKNTGKCMESFQFMNFSEAMFYENYLTSDFHTNAVISPPVCLLVKMASKTVIRPIAVGSHPTVGSKN